MKKQWMIILVVGAVLLLFLSQPKKEAGPYEVANVCSPSSTNKVYGEWYGGQTITNLPFNAEFIEVGVTREPGTTPGPITLSLEEVDEATGFPNGNQVHIYTFLGTLPEGAPTVLTPPVNWKFKYGKKYALIIKAPEADLANALTLHLCNNVYAGGEYVRWTTNRWEGHALQDVPFIITGERTTYHDFLGAMGDFITGEEDLDALWIGGRFWLQ